MRANYNSRAASCTEKCTQNTSYPPLIEIAAELWFAITLHTQQYNDFMLLCVTSFGLDSRLIGVGESCSQRTWTNKGCTSARIKEKELRRRQNSS